MLDVIMSQLTTLGNLALENYIVTALAIAAVVGIITFVILSHKHKKEEKIEAPYEEKKEAETENLPPPLLPPPPQPTPQTSENGKNKLGKMKDMFSKGSSGPEPGSPKPVPPADAQKKDGLMGIARELEKQLNRIDITHASEDHRKWYNQLKMRIEKTKMAINDGDFNAAKRNISGAEMYLKLMVLNSV